MKRYFLYLLIYSVGGFVLERIINLIFLGYWWDNSVLVGPYQPLYGNGVVLTVLFLEFVLPKLKPNRTLRYGVLLLVAIASTALSEAVTGYSYEWITGNHLWDYGQTFTCKLEYVCVLPTSLFGVLSFLVVVFLHKTVDTWTKAIPDWITYTLVVICSIDVIYTMVVLLG